jgi:hypothetical protein
VAAPESANRHAFCVKKHTIVLTPQVSRVLAAMRALLFTTCVSVSASLFATENPMNEIDEYILESIKTRVWSGFDSPEQIQEMITDILEEGANEGMLREAVNLEFAKKRSEEETWPKVTDFDRLNNAFKNLMKSGVLCLHDAGYTMSDGHEDANAVIQSYPSGTFFGYCFYHGQDLERAVTGSGLMLAFDHVEGDVPDKIKVGLAVQIELEKAGFTIDWDQTTSRRINIPKFDWKHRYESRR